MKKLIQSLALVAATVASSNAMASKPAEVVGGDRDFRNTRLVVLTSGTDRGV